MGSSGWVGWGLGLEFLPLFIHVPAQDLIRAHGGLKMALLIFSEDKSERLECWWSLTENTLWSFGLQKQKADLRAELLLRVEERFKGNPSWQPATHETEPATGQTDAQTRFGCRVGIPLLSWRLRTQCLRQSGWGLNMRMDAMMQLDFHCVHTGQVRASWDRGLHNSLFSWLTALHHKLRGNGLHLIWRLHFIAAKPQQTKACPLFNEQSLRERMIAPIDTEFSFIGYISFIFVVVPGSYLNRSWPAVSQSWSLIFTPGSISSERA